MKILITGAHGFVGNRLMQDLDDTVAAPSMRGMREKQSRRYHPHSSNLRCRDV